MNPDDRIVHRILAIDDEPSIHEAYRSILCPQQSATKALDALDEALFGSSTPAAKSGPSSLNLVMHSAMQGQDGFDMLKSAIERNEPYSVAIVDMRMPPGWDGVETVKNLWKVDPDLEIIICSAYSDHPWSSIAQELGNPSKLLLLRKPFESAEVWQLVRSLVHKRMSEAALQGSMAALEATNQRLHGEIEARKSAEGRTLFDPLTGLPNRTLLHRQLAQALERHKRNPSAGFAVVFLDLDRFKEINDAFGHAIGDALLREVGQMLTALLRAVDLTSRDEELAARLGGDEFVLLLDGVRGVEDVRTVTTRITEAFKDPITVQGRSIRVAASMGFALGCSEHQDAEEILRDADAALHHAKRQGRAGICEFNESIREKVLTRRRLAHELRGALARRELSVNYQPLVSLDRQTVVGFEALCRWTHPTLGPISPATFIPIAEEEDLVGDLGAWILREALRQLSEWRVQFPRLAELTMSVNVSHQQLRDANFPTIVEDALKEFGLEGRSLALEMTESIFVTDVEQTTRILDGIRSLGVEVHLDDFGTGFSSLSMFHRLPIDVVKIDRSFVADMHDKGLGSSIVQAIKLIASNRSLGVTAEGIETDQQLMSLREIGCEIGQGYLFARPMNPAEVNRLLSAGGELPVRVPSQPRLADAA